MLALIARFPPPPIFTSPVKITLPPVKLTLVPLPIE